MKINLSKSDLDFIETELINIICELEVLADYKDHPELKQSLEIIKEIKEEIESSIKANRDEVTIDFDSFYARTKVVWDEVRYWLRCNTCRLWIIEGQPSGKPLKHLGAILSRLYPKTKGQT